MTRDEHRAKCLEANALALARNMFPERDLQSLDELGPRLKQCYLSAGQKGLDSLHGIARVNPIEATEEMLDAAYFRCQHDDFKEERETWLAMSTRGDLTNPQEPKT